MDANWRPTQGTESTMDTSDWRTQLQPDSRQRIVNKIMDTLKRHLPVSGQDGLHELRNIAQRFEEKIYTAATSQSDYLRKISLKMLTMENKTQNTMVNAMQSNAGGPSNKPIDSASLDSTAQTAKSGGDDWQEEVFQKIKSMKESYLPELTEMHQKIAAKLQLHEPLPHQAKSEQLEKLKMFKTMLERLIAFLQVSKGHIVPSFKEKMASYEKQIINFINTNRPKRAMPSMQSGQLPPPHENQMNCQMQSTNLQSSVATMPQSSMASLQHNSIPSISGVSTTQQNMINSMQPGANLDSSSVNSLQQVGASTLQQNSVNAPQQTNTNHLSSQGGSSVLQQNSNPLQPGFTMLQHQQLKQPQEQQMLQNQQLKHLQQRQLLQRQQMLQQQQQLLQATKQHLPSEQSSAYPQQQFIQGFPFPVSSSPHNLIQIRQHSSPQVDPQNLPLLGKVSTSMQSANSPLVGATPSPPLAPSPMPGNSKKPISVVSSVSNAANIGHQQKGIATVPAKSPAIVTLGIISPSSPLLAKFSGPNGAHGNALAISSAKLTVALLFFLILWLVFYCC